MGSRISFKLNYFTILNPDKYFGQVIKEIFFLHVTLLQGKPVNKGKSRLLTAYHNMFNGFHLKNENSNSTSLIKLSIPREIFSTCSSATLHIIIIISSLLVPRY